MSAERGPTSEYPDVGPVNPLFHRGLPPEHSEREMQRVAGERSHEDEALRGHKKPSFLKLLLGRDK